MFALASYALIWISIEGWIEQGPIGWIAAIIIIGTLSWTFTEWITNPDRHFIYLTKQGEPEPEAQEPHSPTAAKPNTSDDEAKPECGGR